ncbi:MAG: HEXXH motif-containing putative peptide modification protein [Pseudomonadota bacterium]|nr:HEXXH motif-containing putative peptide modification protein [Pseudomonadota bacterium]
MISTLATPVIKGASSLKVRTLYNEKMLESLEKLLLSISNAGIDVSVVQGYVSTLLPKDSIPSDVFALYHALLSAVKSQNRQSVERCLMQFRIPTLELAGPKLIFGSIGECQRHEDVVPELPNHEKKTPLLPVSREIVQSCSGDAQKALAILKQYHPEMAAEILTLLSGLYFFDDVGTEEQMIGGSDVRVYGDIFLRRHKGEIDPLVYYCEHIVHETSHLYLHALMAMDPLVLNSPDEHYPAPIRSDLRPMYGVFHATFVLSRMCQVFKVLSDQLSDENVCDAHQCFVRQFEHGLSTVNQYAELTTLGQHLIMQYPEVLMKVR